MSAYHLYRMFKRLGQELPHEVQRLQFCDRRFDYTHKHKVTSYKAPVRGTRVQKELIILTRVP